MFCWCRLEDAVNVNLQTSVSEKRKNIAVPLADRLNTLESILIARAPTDPGKILEIRELFVRIGEVRRRRNLIVHGLAGVNADRAKGEPHILCVQNVADRAKLAKITQSELIKLCDGIERCQRDIELVAFAAKSNL